MRFRFRNLLIGIIILLISVSCDQNVVFEQNVKIDNHKWDFNDTVKFITVIADTSQFHDILINVRNGGLYEYSNLYLFINVQAPTGNQITDTLEIILADKRGKWFGSGLGDIKSSITPYKHHIKFSVPGIYTFKITQGMRQKELLQIFDVGLRIQKSQFK